MVTIRPATPDDAEALAALGAKTFLETFLPDSRNRPEEVDRYVRETYTAALQLAEIESPSIATLLAACDGALAGFAQLWIGEPAEACVEGPEPIELRRFYVDAHWHGRGVAHNLMHEVIAASRRLGARTLWLGVWEHNERAKAFYRKCGFVDVGSHLFVLGDDPQTDRIMSRLI